MRTRIGPEASPPAPRGGPSAPGTVGKATKNASPCVSTSTPPCGAERLAHDAAVLGERFRVRLAQLVQELGRALHVGEEERDGPGGKVAPHGVIMRPARR